ncbi:MAG: exo-beta-N-acetylmuramidase NamZ family protein [Gemmatimonadaceae bacterium]
MAQAAPVKSGLEVLLSDSLHLLQGKRVGLITNHTGIDQRGRRNVDLIFKAPRVQLVALFGPEHGFGGAARAGARIGFATDTATGLPVHSLYGETRVPTPEMLKDVDVLVYDIQDVGARVYTYVWTMALAAEAAGKLGKSFIVLDRPNPIRADRVEGGTLENQYRSFVGQYDVALRYGLTPGELLRYLVGTKRVSANVSVVPLQGYRRSMWYSETGLPWLNPSPNIRDEETEVLYPGTVFFEATNLSEGRGTDAPLKQAGAPWLTDAPAIAQVLNDRKLPGVRFEAREVSVRAGDKHGGLTIPVVRLHVTDKNSIEPVATAVALMREIFLRHPAQWAWQRGTGAERLSGTAEFRAAVSDTNRSSTAIRTLLERWRRESAAFQSDTRPYLIYK